MRKNLRDLRDAIQMTVRIDVSRIINFSTIMSTECIEYLYVWIFAKGKIFNKVFMRIQNEI